MLINPGYSGQVFLEESYERIERLRGLVDCLVQVDGGVNEENIARVRKAGADCARRNGSSRTRISRRPTEGWYKHWHEHEAGARARSRRGERGGLPETNGRRGLSWPATRSWARAQPRPPGRHGEVVALEPGWRPRAGRDPLRDDGAVRAPRHDAAVRRCDPRGRYHEGRRRLPRLHPKQRVDLSGWARAGRRGGARGQLRGAAPERGVAHVEGVRPPVRHLQGRDDARRPRHNPKERWVSGRSPAAGCTNFVPPRMRSRSGWALSASKTRDSTRAT